MINNRQYAGRRFNKSVSLRSWGPVYDSATQDVTSLLLLLALYYYLSLSLFFLHLFLTFLAIFYNALSLSPLYIVSSILVSSFSLLFVSLFSREFIIYKVEGACTTSGVF